MGKERRTALRALLVTGCAALTLYGCVKPHTAVIDYRNDIHSAKRMPNLVLGPTPDHCDVAQLFAYRSSWPSVEMGYRFDDTSFLTEVFYDDQSYYDRWGGGFHREVESVRSSVTVR